MSTNSKIKSEPLKMDRLIGFLDRGKLSKASQSKLRRAFAIPKKSKHNPVPAVKVAMQLGFEPSGKQKQTVTRAFAYLADVYNTQISEIIETRQSNRREEQKAMRLLKRKEREKRKAASQVISRFANNSKKMLATAQILFEGYAKKGNKVYLSTSELYTHSKETRKNNKSIAQFVTGAFKAVKKTTKYFYKEVYTLKSTNLYTVPAQPIQRKYLNGTRVQRAGVMELDSERIARNPKWCKERDMCFPDFVQHRLKGAKGFIKRITDDKIQELSLVDADGNVDSALDPEPNKNGYTVQHMLNYCNNVQVSIYVLNDGAIEWSRVNDEGRKSIAFVFEIKNSHLYPILDKGFVKSVVNKFRNLANIDSASYYQSECCAEQQALPVVEYDRADGQGIEYAIRQMVKINVSTYTSGLTLHHGHLSSFVLDGKRYLTVGNEKDDTVIVRQYCAKNGIAYQGQSAQFFVKPFIDAFQKQHYSYFNKQVEEALIKDGVKDRVHLGICSPQFTQRINDHANIKCRDIIKCYRAVMEQPMEDFMVVDFHTLITEPPTAGYPLGLYFVTSDDYTLFHGNNWYSAEMLRFAAKEQIPFVTKAFIPGRSVGRTCLKEMIASILQQTNDAKLTKLMINSIYGYLCKTKSNSTRLCVDTDTNKIWDCYAKWKGVQNHQPFIQSHTINGVEYFAYGDKHTTLHKTHNLPMGIQIQDQANIRLYKMIQEMNGECLYRKTDMAIVWSPDGADDYFDDQHIGGQKWESLPNIASLKQQRPLEARHVDLPILEAQWNEVPADVSDDYQTIIDFALQKQGLLLMGRAGTGKTFVAKKAVAQLLEAKVGHAKLAFTNKATINLNGSTIHNFLKLNKEGKIQKEWVRKIGKTIKVVFVDEISMIDGHLWKLLAEFKELTGCVFVLLGDYRQLPPVCDEAGSDYDWFNHPSVRYLANNNRCELSRLSSNSRYGHKMWDLLEDIYSGEWSTTTQQKMAYQETVAVAELIDCHNISYTNKTRKHINRLVQDALAKHELRVEEIEYTGCVNKYPQDAKLFVGAKLLMAHTKQDKSLKKNEAVCVTELREQTFVVKSSSNAVGVFKYSNFHREFLLGYATTIHKSQGDTLQGRVNIFDSAFIQTDLKDKRALYTALSRATSVDNIHIIRNAE